LQTQYFAGLARPLPLPFAEQWLTHCPDFLIREKTMNKIKRFSIFAAFSMLVLGLPAIASAQYYPNGGAGNGGYGGYGNGQYGDQRSAIRNLKNHTRQFQRQLDRDLDRSRVNGTRREDQINDIVSRFRDAVNDLDNNGYYDNRRGSYGGDSEMRRVYDLAGQIERSIGRANISPSTRNLWGGVRSDLQTLSRGYGSNNGRNNGGWGNGRTGSRNGLPSWWPF
jgi:hypothetical protein